MLKLGLKIVLLMLLCVVIAVGWLLATDGGTRTAFKAIEGLVPGLQVQKINGRLIGPLELNGLLFETDTIRVRVKKAQLNWQPSKLLAAKVSVTELKAAGLYVTQLKSSRPSEEPFVLPDSLPLPVTIRVLALQVNDFQWRAAVDAVPLVINQLSASLVVNADQVDVSSLNVQAPKLTVSGKLFSLVSDNYQSLASIKWSYLDDELVDASGELSLEGDLSKSNIAARANATLFEYGDFSADVHGFANREALTVTELNLERDGTAMVIDGNAFVAFAAEQPTIEAELNWQELQWPLVEQFTRTAPSSSQVQLSQTLTTASQADNADLSNEPLAALISSLKGQLQVFGTLDDYTAGLSAQVSTAQAPNGSVSLKAKGSSEQVKLHDIEFNVLKGAISGEVSLSWAEQFKAQFNLRGEDLDPGELLKDWPGQLGFTAQGMQRGGEINIEQLNAFGKLRDNPFQLQAKLDYDGETAHVQALKLRSGSSRLTANGSIGAQSNFSWQLNSADLSTLYPDAKGRVISDGRIIGSLPLPNIKAELKGSAVSIEGLRIGNIDLNANVNLKSEKPSRLRLLAENLVVAKTELARLSLAVDGDRESHTLQFDANTEFGAAALSVSGALIDEEWLGKLTAGELNPADVEAWALSTPADLTLSAKQQKLGRSCWSSGEAMVCLAGSNEGEERGLQMTVKQFDLSYLQSLLAPELRVQGSFEAEVDAVQTSSKQWKLAAQLNNSDSEVLLRATKQQDEARLIGFAPGSVKIDGDQSAVVSRISLPFADGGGISSDVSLSSLGVLFDNSSGKDKLQGSVNLDIPDIAFIAPFSPEVQALGGAILGAFSLSGSLEKPELSGTLSVQNGKADLVSPGLSLSDVQFSATAKPGGVLEYEGSLASDGGHLQLQGESILRGDASSTELTVSGEQFQVWNNADARVWASPNLQLNLQGAAIKVRGEINVPRAQITPKELPQSAVNVSRDQIIVSADEQDVELVDTSEQTAIDARLKIRLGDKVEIVGFGFKGRLEGALDVSQRNGKPMVASGELNVKEGEYRAYGQGLVVDRGQILFAGGEIDNPGLSVRAIRRPAENILVGVNVFGELREPEISLFSEPGMSSSNQLSWLVLGRSMDNSSGAESDYISQAALALGVKGGNFLTKGIGDNLGLDSIGIETGSGEAGAASDVNQAALVIGKYITPKLYVSYGVGLLDSLSTVKLRYLMTKRWNLVTESSAVSSGGDVSYSFEK
ncbi:MAG: translocation/assembly module TamB domain-containing protein [Pseudomonadales bacterium]